MTFTPMDEPSLSEEDGVRYLHFGSPWVQGAMQIRRPDHLVLEYTRQMMAWALFVEPTADDRFANLGLGAAAVVRYLLAHTPVSVDTVERNPQVTAACQAWFRFQPSARATVIHEDASQWVDRPENHGQYRVLLVDLYDSAAQGPVCDTPEFYRGCHDVLTADGLMVVNLFGNHPSYEHNLHTINQAFSDRVAVLPPSRAGNRIVLAFRPGALQAATAASVLAQADKLSQTFGYPAHKWARSCLTQLQNGNQAPEMR